MARREGGDAASADYEEYRRHLEHIIDLCREIQESTTPQVRRVFSDSAECLDSEMQFIRRNEIRINRQNEQAITHLGQITQNKKELAKQLRQLIGKVKEYDFESKELQTNITTFTNQFDEKMADMGGQK